MDGLTFTDHLIGHLAWPLVVAGLVVFLSLRHRAALDTLLHRVRKARAGPFEAELDEAKAEADRANLPPAPAVLPPSDIDREELWAADAEKMDRLRIEEPEEWLPFFMEMADRFPFNAAHGAYRRLYAYLRYAAHRLDPERMRDEGPWGWTSNILETGLLTPEHVRVWQRLDEALRAAEDWDARVSRQQAREFVLLVARLVSAVQERLHMLLETRKPP
jgi:hypothetical protein